MEYSEIIYLINKTTTKDEIGNTISSLSTQNKSYAKRFA